MAGIQKSPFTTIITINLSKTHQWMLKPWVNAFLGTGCSYSLKVLPHRWHTDYKGERYICRRKSGRHYLRERIKFNNPNSTNWYHLPPDVMCYRLNICVPPTLICWNPNLQCDGIRIWGLRVVIRSRGSAFVNGISAIIRDWRGQSSLLPLHKDTARCQKSASQKRAITRTQPCWHPDHRLPDSKIVRNRFPLFISHSIYGTSLEQSKLTKPWCI